MKHKIRARIAEIAAAGLMGLIATGAVVGDNHIESNRNSERFTMAKMPGYTPVNQRGVFDEDGDGHPDYTLSRTIAMTGGGYLATKDEPTEQETAEFYRQKKNWESGRNESN